jgi:NAD(P)-dependent dehydrogenase (short-subunit alcohol dehydrogenase family)
VTSPLNIDLSGRHVLVTGAGRGLGRGCAVALAGCGASVTLVSRTESELEETAETIRAAGGSADICVGDLTDAASVDRAIAQAAMHVGLWGCVNSAGTNRTGATVDYPIEDWDAVIAVNMRATFLVCRAMGRVLVARGNGGRILNISSQMGSVGYPGRAAYCASKHAVNGLTKALAVEWAPDRVTVNAVAPTFVDTPLTAPMLADDAFRAEVLRRIPMGRIATVKDVSGAVAFLLSDAAGMITGEVLLVDGGWVAW